MIVLHELPFSIVEYDGFKEFIYSLNPLFKIVCIMNNYKVRLHEGF